MSHRKAPARGMCTAVVLPHGVPATIYQSANRIGAGAADPPTLVLAHGAGAGQHHAFMIEAATALAARGLEVVTFDFPYVTAGRRLPDRAPALEQAWCAVIEHLVNLGRKTFIIGGKSMGGRMATHVMAQPDAPASVAGIVLLGYPLAPPRRPGTRRDAHLPAIAVPLLFVHGTRDAFGTPDEMSSLVARLGPTATLHVVDAADHAFAFRRSARATCATVMAAAWDTVAAWVRATVGARRRFG